MLFGENKNHKEFLLKICNLENEDFGRYRDIYVTPEHVVVHTRNGGGNREEYQDTLDELANHPLHCYDEDDDFDCTYCNIYYKHPEGYEEILKEMAANTVTPSEKWEMLFSAMDKKSA